MTGLAGKVAIVTGASRGIGKGIALALAEAGATVYVTGRSVGEGDHALPGTVGATAAECTARGRASGGGGIAVQVDHADDDRVASLFDRVRRDRGRLDILVNNAFAIPEDLTDPGGFWEKPLSNLQMFDVGVKSNFVAAWHAARIMVPQGSGLIVAISGYVGRTYTYGALFGTCKAAVDRMARDMAIELQPHAVTSISLWQGLTLTERANRNIENNPAMKASIVTNPLVGCSPEYPGRVIAALAADANAQRHSGGTFITAELARQYGVTDIDGKVIPSLREQRGAPIWEPIAPA